MVDQVQLYVSSSSQPSGADCAFVALDVLSAALDSGVAVAIIIIFFALQYPQNGNIGKNTIQSWWGNTVSFNNADGMALPLIPLAKGQSFG